MARRQRHSVCATRRTSIATLVCAALVCVSLSACSSGTRDRYPAPPASVGQQLDDPLPAGIEQETLETSTGHLTSLAALKGKVIVISDMMTLCQETCPLDTANLVDAASDAERAGLGDKIAFLSITVDPGRDTAARLAAYRRLYTPAPSDWITLTGTPTNLAALWNYLGVYRQQVPDTPPAPKDWLTGKPLTYDITHSDETFFIDTSGTERYLLEGAPHVAADAPIPSTLRTFMDASGLQNLNHPDSEAWTLPQLEQVLSWLTQRPIASGTSSASTG